MMIMGMIGGAIWGFFPGFLKAKFNVNEIITTLMLNYVAILWNNFWIFDRWSEGGFQMTPMFEKSAWLPRLADWDQHNQAGEESAHVELTFSADVPQLHLEGHRPS